MKKLDSEKYSSTADEHILVCLSPSPTNAKIVRTAARMAAAAVWGLVCPCANQ